MTNNSNNKKKIIITGCICAAVVAIIAIAIVAVILSTNNGSGRIDESYFKTDDSKYVITLDYDPSEEGNDDYTPLKTHSVYTHSGGKITGLTTYYEYTDEASAKNAYNKLIDEVSGEFKSITQNGKFVLLESNPEDYEGLSAEDVKSQIEFIESIKNGEYEETTTEEIVTDGAETIESSSETIETTVDGQ